MAKVLNSSKLLSRISDRPANCKNLLRTVRIGYDIHELSTIQPRIQIVSIRVNSWDSGPVWNRGIIKEMHDHFRPHNQRFYKLTDAYETGYMHG